MSDSEEKKSLKNEQNAETPAAETAAAETTQTKASTSSDTAAGTATVSSVTVESEKKTDTKTASKAKLCFPKVNFLQAMAQVSSSRNLLIKFVQSHYVIDF